MAMLSALRSMLAAFPVTAIDRKHSTLLKACGFGRKTVVDSLQDRLWNAKSEIAPFVARVPVSDHEHTRLMLEKLADLIWAYVPHLRDLDDRVVTLRGCDGFPVC